MHNFYFKKPSLYSREAMWAIHYDGTFLPKEIDLSHVHAGDFDLFYPFKSMEAYLVVFNIKTKKYKNFYA